MQGKAYIEELPRGYDMNQEQLKNKPASSYVKHNDQPRMHRRAVKRS